MDVLRASIAGNADFVDLFDPSVQVYSLYPNSTGTGNPAFYNAVNRPNNPAVFDTWSAAVDPNNSAYNYKSWNTPRQPNSIPIYLGSDGQPISVRAVQITLRVWDFKTKKTRQVTMVQQV